MLENEIVACRRCPRLVQHREQVGMVKRRAYLDWEYWAKPVPSFGDPEARVLLIGLAPGAHGANRTGRMFTGDSSGDWLYAAMYAEGFASQPASVRAGDGLYVMDAYITASVRCAPPDNRPEPGEIANCRSYLERELDLLPNVQVIVALGRLAFDNYLRLQVDRKTIRSRQPFTFGHNRAHTLSTALPTLISSFHPSQQNTSTKKLTAEMLRAVFQHARVILEGNSQKTLPANQ